MHVGAPEGVDGLLGVAHQHQRRTIVSPVGVGRAPERRSQDVPLHLVGVLELVDHDQPVALAQPPADHVALRAGEGLFEPA